RRRHTRSKRDWSSDVCSSDLIPKHKNIRQYEAVPEVEMGAQIQVDWGETKQKTRNEEEIKLHFISFVLSHSRYKYIEWLDRPFRSEERRVGKECRYQCAME